MSSFITSLIFLPCNVAAALSWVWRTVVVSNVNRLSRVRVGWTVVSWAEVAGSTLRVRARRLDIGLVDMMVGFLFSGWWWVRSWLGEVLRLVRGLGRRSRTGRRGRCPNWR